MKTTILTTLLSSALLTKAQLAYDHSTQSLKCALPNGIYCVGDSMSQSYIARCNAGVATISCCTTELSSLPPLGLKPAALCFQSSPTSGDASCVLNGTTHSADGPSTSPAPVKPIPAVPNTDHESPKDCHNGTHPHGPAAGPPRPIPPPPPSRTPLPPTIPQSYPTAPPSNASKPLSPIAPPPPSNASKPLSPIAPPPPPASTPTFPTIHPTAGQSGHALPTLLLPTASGNPPKPSSPSSSFAYTFGKPTATPTPSGAITSPVRGSDAAGGRKAPVVSLMGIVCVLFSVLLV
ncbi:hypothetical protein FKW77_010344 [Venturia effusa]|uniref:Uncharacterized protein n=1 Tax=Venturia effusa TaxID=50376 RepID=A0A517KXQ0_9PEZI|nr:hypothetical protein FKW77_010344 [Venturia effusa]